MGSIWCISNEDKRLSGEEQEFLSGYYELCYLYAAHEYLKREDIDTIVTGSSYGVNAIETPYMRHKAVNLSMHAQDLYYSCLQVKKALTESNRIKNVVMMLGYYNMFYDLSLSRNNYKCVMIYRPLFDDSHNLDDSGIEIEDLAGWLEKHRTSIIEYFGDSPDYWGKSIERECINKEIYSYYGWYRIDKSERLRIAEELVQKHNKHIKYIKTYEENVFVLSDLFAQLERAGINIYVVISPFTPEYNTYIRKEYKQYFEEFLNAVPFPIHYLDMNEIGFDSIEYFVDSDHLNLRGAIEATRILDDFMDQTDNLPS